MTTVLKLGGSVVTEKAEPETVDDRALAAAADAVAGAVGRAEDASPEDASAPVPTVDGGAGLVVVHGGGSFGHPHADRQDVGTATGTRDARAIDVIHAAMGRLNARVVGALQKRGVPAVPVRPLSMAARGDDGTATVAATAVASLLDEGFVPVAHGDVIAHAGAGATILSGDELVVELARETAAERVGLCSTVPGVLDTDGVVIDRIESFEAVAAALGASDAPDVTGGMAGKVRTLLDLSVPASVFGPDALGPFLAGGSPGTTID